MSKKEVQSFRLSQESINQLDAIKQIANEEAQLLGIAEISRADLIEEAIGLLYAAKMDEKSGSAFLNRIELSIDHAIKKALEKRDENMNMILFNEYQIMEILYLFTKTNPDLPRNEESIIDILYSKKSIYEKYISDCVQVKLKRTDVPGKLPGEEKTLNK